MPCAQLKRTVLSLEGENVDGFLGGLISNSITGDVSFAALLSPQGKIIADFFIHRLADDHLLIETPEKFGRPLLMRLKMYRLRARVEIEDISDTHFVYAFWDGTGVAGHPDPRFAALGERLLTTDHIETNAGVEDYDLHRLRLGVPDSEWDFDTEEMYPHDVNMDMLHGVDFKKGCFIGQEVVSRMQRKTVVRKRMRAVRLSGSAAPGDNIIAAERLIGTLKHVRNERGMALIRLDRLAESKEDIQVGGQRVEILEPEYVHKHS